MTTDKTPAEGPLIHKAMLAIMGDLDAIGKNKRNASQGFNYRGVDDVYNELHPLLCKHGVYMTAEVLDKHREDRQTKSGGGLVYTSLTMRYSFIAADGSSVRTEAQGEGMDSGDKSSNKAMAVAHKYALFQAFCIPTEDMPDPDAESHEVQPKRAPAPPAPPKPPAPDYTADDLGAWAISIQQGIESAKDMPTLDDIMKRNKDKLTAMKKLAMPEFDATVAAASKRKEFLTAKKEA